jgi:branched-chain amino acid aminotransferase
VACSKRPTGVIVYLNGRFLPLEHAHLSPLDRGFQYGDGVFETLRAQSGQILYLDQHLQRLQGSLQELNLAGQLMLDWKAILEELLGRNHLEGGVAAVKIVVTRGLSSQLGLPRSDPPTLFMHARPYDVPTAARYAQGWRLHVYRQGSAPPLARHKSLNYLYYLMARQGALDAGADEAVLLDARSRVTETAAGSLLARTDDQWWTPHSPDQLHGITLQQVTRILQHQGRSVRARPAGIQELAGAQTIWVLNSLLGIMPAVALDEQPVAHPEVAEAAELRAVFFKDGKAPPNVEGAQRSPQTPGT